MDRKEPTSNRLDVPFYTFPGTATIVFEANLAENVPPASSITVEAGRVGTWVIRFSPDEMLPAGSRVAFTKMENEFRFDWIHQDYWPESMGYVTVEEGAGEPLPFECETVFKAATPAIVTLPRDWRPGEIIVMRMGDQRFGGTGCQVQPARYDAAHIEVGVALPGDKRYRPVPNATMTVRVVPCQPVHSYYFFAPSNAQLGETFEVTALPVDINGNAIDVDHPVKLAATGDTFQAVGKGLHATASVERSGVARLELVDEERGIRAISNPIKVGENEWNVYWGEFHCHGYDGSEINVLNEGTHPRGAFEYGRDVTRLDFMSMGSHIFRQAPQAVYKWWELARQAAQAVDAPGRFVSFLGCEWRDGEQIGGDRNLIWRELDAPTPDPTWKIDQVFAQMARQQGMVTPHVGGAIAFPTCHDDKVEHLCEMTSGHGNFEWFGQAYLQKGYRVGFIGGSDGHKATPGHPRIVSSEGGRFFGLLRRRDAGWYGGPILGVCAKELTREALWEAFSQRRVYATTGARALVDFSANGVFMGGELSVDHEVALKIAIEGTAPLERVDLIRDTQRLARWEPGELSFGTEIVDCPPTGASYYYLRIEQEDGEMIWSSPIWVESTCGGSAEGLPAWNEPEVIEIDPIRAQDAAEHLPALMDYLEREECAAAFENITPLKVVHSPMGPYAVFLMQVRGKRIRIHFFYGFEHPRLRLEVGWVQYGREIIKGQDWTRPLFDGQVYMG